MCENGQRYLKYYLCNEHKKAQVLRSNTGTGIYYPKGDDGWYVLGDSSELHYPSELGNSRSRASNITTKLNLT